MFGKTSRSTRNHLRAHGRRAPAVVVEIASWGLNIGDDQQRTRQAVRKTTLRVEPEGEPAFMVTKRFRYGEYGEYLPVAGDEIEVLYDPDDPEAIMLAPPTAEQEARRAAQALSASGLFG